MNELEVLKKKAIEAGVNATDYGDERDYKTGVAYMKARWEIQEYFHQLAHKVLDEISEEVLLRKTEDATELYIRMKEDSKPE